MLRFVSSILCTGAALVSEGGAQLLDEHLELLDSFASLVEGSKGLDLTTKRDGGPRPRGRRNVAASSSTKVAARRNPESLIARRRIELKGVPG